MNVGKLHRGGGGGRERQREREREIQADYPTVRHTWLTLCMDTSNAFHFSNVSICQREWIKVMYNSLSLGCGTCKFVMLYCTFPFPMFTQPR